MPSAFTTFRWSFSSAVHWPTTLRNLLLDPWSSMRSERKRSIGLNLIEQEPDAGLGNGGLGRLAACFLDSMATMQLPATGYGLRYEYGMFRQSIVNGWQQGERGQLAARRRPLGDRPRQHEKVEVKLNCSFKLRGGNFKVIPGPAIEPDRHTLSIDQSWATEERRSTPSGFGPRQHPITSISRNSAREILSARWARLWKRSRSPGCCIRTTPRHGDRDCASCRSISWWRARWPTWCAVFSATTRIGTSCRTKVAIQLNDTHPSMSVAELMRILLDDAHLGWDKAWDLTRRTLAYTNHTLLPEALEKWPVAWFEILLPRHLEIIYEINRRLLDEVRLRFPGDEGRVERVSLVEEGNRAQDPHGQPGDRRLAQHEWSGRRALEAIADDDGQGSGRNVSRTLQQQDQRSYTAPLAAGSQSRAGAEPSRKRSVTRGLPT